MARSQWAGSSCLKSSERLSSSDWHLLEQPVRREFSASVTGVSSDPRRKTVGGGVVAMASLMTEREGEEVAGRRESSSESRGQARRQSISSSSL